MAKKAKKAKSALLGWKPSPYDAMNLASLRYYAMEIEQLSISVYAGDDDDRTKFKALVVDLADFLTFARAKYKIKSVAKNVAKKKKGGLVLSDECYDSWLLCSGLCVPPDQCDR